MRVLSILLAMAAASSAVQAQTHTAPTNTKEIYARAFDASATLKEHIASVEGCYGVKSAHAHDGTELIFAWFEDRQAVLRWFEHDYHRKLLRDAGRPEDHVAAEHFGDDVGPILVVASVAYPAGRGSIEESMFDDPVAGRPSRFAIEYYAPLDGGAYMVKPFAPWAVTARTPGMRDVFADEEDDKDKNVDQ